MPFCPRCGKEASADDVFCRNCGADLKMSASSAPSAAPMAISAPAQAPAPTSARPTGVSVLALLGVIGGVLLFVGGFYYVAGGDSALGSYSAQIGLLSAVDGWGMWKGKGWSWNLFLVTAVISIIATPIMESANGLAGGVTSVVTILLELLFVYYITRPHVMSYFDKKSISEEFF